MMFHRYVTNVSSTSPAAGKGGRETYSYFVAGAIGSTVGVLHKWTAEEFASPAEDVADILTQIFISGILPYLNRASL